MVMYKVQISAVVQQQNDETKTNEKNKKTDRLIGKYILVISFDDGFNHDEDVDDVDDYNDGGHYIYQDDDDNDNANDDDDGNDD